MSLHKASGKLTCAALLIAIAGAAGVMLAVSRFSDELKNFSRAKVSDVTMGPTADSTVLKADTGPGTHGDGNLNLSYKEPLQDFQTSSLPWISGILVLLNVIMIVACDGMFKDRKPEVVVAIVICLVLTMVEVFLLLYSLYTFWSFFTVFDVVQKYRCPKIQPIPLEVFGLANIPAASVMDFCKSIDTGGKLRKNLAAVVLSAGLLIFAAILQMLVFVSGIFAARHMIRELYKTNNLKQALRRAKQSKQELEDDLKKGRTSDARRHYSDEDDDYYYSGDDDYSGDESDDDYLSDYEDEQRTFDGSYVEGSESVSGSGGVETSEQSY